MNDQYELAQRLETLAEKIEDDPNWYGDLSFEDEDLVELFREVAEKLRDGCK